MTEVSSLARRTPSGERMRRLRQRRKDGIAMVVPFQIFAEELDALVARGLLPADRRNDRVWVLRAVEKLVEAAIS